MQIAFILVRYSMFFPVLMHKGWLNTLHQKRHFLSTRVNDSGENQSFFQMHLSTHNLIKQVWDSELPISHLQSAIYQLYQVTTTPRCPLSYCSVCVAGYKHLFSPSFRSPFQRQASLLGHFSQHAPGSFIILLWELLGQADFLDVLSQVSF